MFLDGRLLEAFPEATDIGRDMHRLDIDQLLDILAPIAPGEEAPAGVKVSRARVLVVDGDGEEFQKSAHRVIAARSDDRRYDRSARRPCFHDRPSAGFDCHKLG